MLYVAWDMDADVNLGKVQISIFPCAELSICSYTLGLAYGKFQCSKKHLKSLMLAIEQWKGQCLKLALSLIPTVFCSETMLFQVTEKKTVEDL